MELQHREEDRIKEVACLQVDESDEDGVILGYYVVRWLHLMGYDSSKNKRYFMSRIKLVVGDSKAHKFAKIYTNLHLLNLSTCNLL
jgi:hypothetical protein